MNDQQLKKLLKAYREFLSQDKKSQEIIEKIRALYRFAKTNFLNLGVLSRLKDDELYNRLVVYTRKLYGVKISYGKPRLTAFMPYFKKAMNYIVNSSDPVEVRLSNVISQDKKLIFAHMKRQFWTPIFAAIDAKKYPNWTNKTDAALTTLGFEMGKGQTTDKQYRQVIDAFRKLESLEPSINFVKLDYFVHYVETLPEGKELTQKLLGEAKNGDDGRETNTPGSESAVQQILQKKKQVILYGPPGTGKTYSTKEMAIALIEDLYLDGAESKPVRTEGKSENPLFHQIVQSIERLSAVERKASKTMVGYYSISRKTNKRLGLVWIDYPRARKSDFVVYLRKGGGARYPEKLTRPLSRFGENGWGGYPYSRIKNENDAKITIKLIEYAYDNL